MANAIKFALLTFILIVIAIVFLKYVAGAATIVPPEDDYYYYGGVRYYISKNECNRNETCIHTEDCLDPVRSPRKCPLLTHIGVSCCEKIILRDFPCLGNCLKIKCPFNTKMPATDCAPDEECCKIEQDPLSVVIDI